MAGLLMLVNISKQRGVSTLHFWVLLYFAGDVLKGDKHKY